MNICRAARAYGRWFCGALGALFISGCSGVFVNPDLVNTQGGVPASRLFTLSLPTMPPQEARLLNDLKYNFISIKDFFTLQGALFDLAKSCQSMGDSMVFSIGEASIQHRDETGNKRDLSWYDHRQLLSDAIRDSYAVFQVDNLFSDQLTNVLTAGIPVLCFGQCRFKHQMQQDKGEEDAVFVFDGYTLIYGYERYRDPGSGYDNVSPNRVRFFTRDGLGLRCEDTSSMSEKALYIDNSIDRNGRWLLKQFYTILPAAVDADSLRARCGSELKIVQVAQTASLEFKDRFSCERSKNLEVEKKKQEEKEAPKPVDTSTPPVNVTPQINVPQRF